MENSSSNKLLKSDFYFISLSKCIDEATEKAVPKIKSLINGNYLFGNTDSLNLRLIKDKNAINQLVYQIVKSNHLDYFRYLKTKDTVDNRGKLRDLIHVYANSEDMHGEVITGMEPEVLEMIYQIQENQDIFRKNTRSKFPEFDYTMETWEENYEKLAKLDDLIKKYLEYKGLIEREEKIVLDVQEPKPKRKVYYL
ncbi:MAG: hypothetical protein IJ093_00865 [Bacilli bacterium]|nr:hypothetical protein [Bacilli bacterium]